jgi:hypothetical protein
VGNYTVNESALFSATTAPAAPVRIMEGRTSTADGADMPNRRLNPAALTGSYGAEELAAPPDLLWVWVRPT